MRVLFLRETTEYSFPMLGFGMGIVATVASQAGHLVKVVDNNAGYRHYSHRDFAKVVREFEPDLLAFSITMLNAGLTYDLLAYLRSQFPGLPSLAGGIHMRHCSAEALEHGFDMVVDREGEMVIGPLLAHLEGRTRADYAAGLDALAGVSFNRPDGTRHMATEFPALCDLDEAPFVDYGLFNLQDYFKNGKEPGSISICGQRGCPFHCTFCSDPVQRVDKRMHSADYMFRYVRHLYQNYGLRYIVLNDNNFTHPRERAMAFCEKVIASPLRGNVKFSIQTKAETPLDDELVGMLKKAGVVCVGMGIERMDRYSQKMIRKLTPHKKIFERLETLKRHDVNILVYMLVGFPFDTAEILDKERENFLGLLKYTRNINTSILQPVPGTAYKDTPKAKGWYLDPKLHVYWRSYFSSVFHSYMLNQLEANLFDLDRATLDKIRDVYIEFRKLSHAYYLDDSSLFNRAMLAGDKLLGLASRAVFALSPDLEFAIFTRIKHLRYYLGTMLLGDKVFASHAEQVGPEGPEGGRGE